jgi:hypothetical protein
MLLALAYFGLNYLAVVPTLAVAIVCFIAYMAVYAVLLIALKAVDKEDIMILSAIENKLGLHIVPRIEKALQ